MLEPDDKNIHEYVDRKMEEYCGNKGLAHTRYLYRNMPMTVEEQRLIVAQRKVDEWVKPFMLGVIYVLSKIYIHDHGYDSLSADMALMTGTWLAYYLVQLIVRCLLMLCGKYPTVEKVYESRQDSDRDNSDKE